jgi:EAL domain-containing protein (putative c-di-GMP-specific phosphodiesterase class I)
MDMYQEIKKQLRIKTLESYFQPIYNLRTGAILGVEALLRPVSTTGEHLAPAILFQEAEMNGCLLEVEREARVVALKAFSAELPAKDIILFLNFAASLLDTGNLDPELVLSTVRHYGLAVRNVAVEMVESGAHSLEELSRFSKAVRQAGFLICLDNFGTEHSSLERVALIRPDIIKIDRSIVNGVDESPRKRSVLRSVAYMAKSIGALSLAEGIERYEDLQVSALEGIDLAQGFLLGRPVPTVETAFHRKEKSSTPYFDTLEQDLREHLRSQSDLFGTIHEYVDALAKSLAQQPLVTLEQELERVILDISVFDAGYILNPQGVQVTRTVMTRQRKRQERHPLFHPTPQGTNHRLKNYAYGPGALDRDRFITKPYRSLNSGELCRTISRRFVTTDGQELIVCVDIPEGADQ